MLEKLIRRDPPEIIGYGSVVNVERQNRRVRVLWRNDMEIWAGFVPEDFPEIEEEQTVALGVIRGEAFVIRVLAQTLPSEITLLEV